MESYGEKMKRFWGILLLLLALLLLFSACTTQDDGISLSFDIQILGEKLLQEASFDDELVKLNDLAAQATWQVKCEKMIAYAGSGATAEEIVIVDASDHDGANEALKLLTAYRDTRRDLFAGYNAGQVPRIESAVLTVADHYVIYCVSADNAAAQKIVDAFIADQAK